jgi:hypothetical protein
MQISTALEMLPVLYTANEAPYFKLVFLRVLQEPN